MRTTILHGILAITLIFSLFTVSTPVVAAEEQSEPQENREPVTENWTFMVYMAADNNLDPVAMEDLNEMEVAGSTADVNIIVLQDRYGNDNTQLYRVTKEATPSTEIVSTPLTGPFGTETNMGDPATLISFVEWTITNYPASHYSLIMWDHGSGWKTLKVSETPFKGVC
jgi:hypothetical protein